MRPPDRPAGATSPSVYDDEGLRAKLELEYKIRDSAAAMLQNLDLSGSRKEAQRRRIVVELEASETRIADIRRRLRSNSASSISSRATSNTGTTADINGRPQLRIDPPLRGFAVPEMMSSDEESVTSPRRLLSPRNASQTDLLSVDPDGSSLSLESSGRWLAKMFGALDTARAPSQQDLKLIDRIHGLLAAYPALHNEIALEEACDKLRGWFVVGTPSATVPALRLCELLSNDEAALETVRTRLQLDWVFARSLAQEDSNANHSERLQVLHSVRRCLQLNGISPVVVRALVAVAEQPADQLRPIAIETLAELVVSDPATAAAGGAFRLLLGILAEGPPPLLAEALAMVFVRILDNPDSRGFLRGGRDLGILLTPFTELASASSDRLTAAGASLTVVLKSWAGFMTLDFELLVRSMSVPSRGVQETLLQAISTALSPPRNSLERQYCACLLQKLLAAGLLKQLAILRCGGDRGEISSTVVARATKLLGDVVERSTTLMPRVLIERLLSITGYEKGSNTVFAVDQELRLRADPPEKPAAAHEAYVRMGTQMDDTTFKYLVASTHVLDTKAYKQWNWDALLELIQGPLRNPKRLDDAIRTTKFMKRLLSFYRPFKYRFSNLPVTCEHRRYALVGVELVSSLLHTTEGARYLATNKLLRQIAECLAQLDPDSGITSSEPLLSPRRFRTTQCSAYLDMIGVLSRSPTGQQILAQMRVFNMLHRIVANTSRDDVTRATITALDYSLEGHPRLIFEQALHASSKAVRRYATEHLATLAKGSGPATIWAVDQLVGQLYDVDSEVCNSAGRILVSMGDGEGTDQFIALKPRLGHLPLATAAPLEMMYLSRGVQDPGYAARELDLWASEFNEAYADHVEAFLESTDGVAGVKSPAPNGFNAASTAAIESRQLPPHFFGELVRTDAGCALLKRSEYLIKLASLIEKAANAIEPPQSGASIADSVSDAKSDEDSGENNDIENKTADDTGSNENSKSDPIRGIKGALWALGHVGSHCRGAALLPTGVVTNIIAVYASSSSIYSVRGTAFYALGLLSLSLEGAELLWDCGWAVSYDMYGHPNGIALPMNVSLRPELAPIKGSVLENMPSDVDFDFSDGPLAFPHVRDPAADQILCAISDLSNFILAHEASKRLVALRASHPTLFQTPEVFTDAMKLLERGHYKQLVRRFLFELFDLPAVLHTLGRRRRGSRI